jgi:beta-lactamase superfamily II metal-dependent hydrolase
MASYGDIIDIDVLKIAHHGSARSTTQEFLDATTPDIAIINAGAGNDYGHPHRETLEILDKNNVTALRTDQNGDIAIFISDADISCAVENAA